MKKNKYLVLLLLLCLLIEPSFASQSNMQSMIANTKPIWTKWITIVTMIGGFIGFYLIIKGVMKVADLGDQGGRAKPSEPFVLAISGTFLIYLSYSMSIVSNSIGLGDGPGSVLVSASSGSSAAITAMTDSILEFMRAMGYTFFIVGLYKLSSLFGERGGHDSGWMTTFQIFGAVGLIHFQKLAHMIGTSFGINIPI